MRLKVIIGPFEGHFDFLKPGLHHATELGVQANQVVCGSRFLMSFFLICFCEYGIWNVPWAVRASSKYLRQFQALVEIGSSERLGSTEWFCRPTQIAQSDRWKMPRTNSRVISVNSNPLNPTNKSRSQILSPWWNWWFSKQNWDLKISSRIFVINLLSSIHKSEHSCSN